MDLKREAQLQKAVLLQTQFAPQVQELLQPALTALGLDYFWYVRLFEGEFHISIGIESPLVALYYKRRTEDLYFNTPSILSQKQTTVIWDLHERTILTEDMTDKIGLKNGMCIFRRQKSYVDIWYVASRNHNSNLYQLYLNNTNAIYRLIGFFQERVLPILPMKDPKFLLPYMDGCSLIFPPMEPGGKNPILMDFYDATAVKKFTLHAQNGEINLTLREIQCLHRLSKGETSKDIAAALGLSFRTVEHYLEGLRNKTGCIDKTQLITMYQKNDVSLWFHA